MKKWAIPLIKMKRSKGRMKDLNEEQQFEYWFDNMYLKLREVARKHGFTVRIFGKTNDPTQFADFMIALDEHSMLGLTLNPEMAVKPFKIFPEGVDIGLNEIDEFLGEFEVAHDTPR